MNSLTSDGGDSFKQLRDCHVYSLSSFRLLPGRIQLDGTEDASVNATFIYFSTAQQSVIYSKDEVMFG